MQTNALQLVTLGIALLGAVLGVLNTWRTFANDQVRLRVRESFAIGPMGDKAVTVNVVNLSTFPVTITTVGFDLAGGARHLQVPRPLFTQGESLPVRLEPRAACTVVQPLAALEPDQWQMITRAYVKTACGLDVKGAGRIFRQR